MLLNIIIKIPFISKINEIVNNEIEYIYTHNNYSQERYKAFLKNIDKEKKKIILLLNIKRKIYFIMIILFLLIFLCCIKIIFAYIFLFFLLLLSNNNLLLILGLMSFLIYFVKSESVYFKIYSKLFIEYINNLLKYDNIIYFLKLLSSDYIKSYKIKEFPYKNSINLACDKKKVGVKSYIYRYKTCLEIKTQDNIKYTILLYNIIYTRCCEIETVEEISTMDHEKGYSSKKLVEVVVYETLINEEFILKLINNNKIRTFRIYNIPKKCGILQILNISKINEEISEFLKLKQRVNNNLHNCKLNDNYIIEYKKKK